MYPRILQRLDNFLVNTIYRYANRKWFGAPLIKVPVGNFDDYQAIANKAKTEQFQVVDEIEKEINISIDKEWFHQLALQTQVVKKKSKIVYQHGRLLYSMLGSYIRQHQSKYLNIVETGTARGFSALCMAKALADAQKQGRIFTFDVLPHHHKMYWNCIADTNGKNTRSELLRDYADFTQQYIVFIQGNTLTEMKKIQFERVHFAFLDGGHDFYHVMKEFKQIKDFQQQGDIIFFDDYTPKLFPGVVKAVDKICQEYNYNKRIIKISDERAYVIATKL